MLRRPDRGTAPVCLPRAIPPTRERRSTTYLRNNMLVAPLSAQHQFELIDAPRPPEPGPGEIQVAVKAIGICGSDLHNFSEGGIGGSPCVYPMVLGHEPSG